MASPSAKPLQGKVAIVTGASRGLGAEIARRLGADGASVLITYRSSTSADAARALADSLPSPAATQQADVSKAADVARAFDAAERHFGAGAGAGAGVVDILVNNAGVIDPAKTAVADTPEQVWDDVLATNARGTFLGCREACARLRRPGGRIVNVSGTLAAAPRPGFGAYAASKAAVEALTKVVAAELAGTGISVNCVAPGPMPTDMFFSVHGGRPAAADPPHGNTVECRDVADVVCFLAGPRGAGISGEIIRINGGRAA